ncbi:RNA binding S1 domain protein [Pirellula staleyi DSM 6068]|uniref:RNA binding S1 domain protein n=1 Tax=Pirellula staleyi (strain ATCC 27377 / DSM 6068 / ICPB 4128) TaxID=530564 RepID=D2QZJ0_PIRSD|nr:Tex-like N-terminal domain-containing protein [Pirellula staleyi]ADB14748.1 RNA binding S1 domain protein [Pirellula staleyi DSM 6068]
MNQPHRIDLALVARDLHLPVDKIERTVSLLDDGNTVPFITRYRKDQTGGLDEEQIREIQDRVTKLRMLAERKATILKSIESQGKLTPELAEEIQAAPTTKRLEDLYLPFKPKKQTLATVARQRGLEPLAREILEADAAATDLLVRAADFVSPDRELNSAAEVLLGVGHLLAERFSENAELRGRLRKIFQKTGKLVSTKIEPPAAGSPEAAAAAVAAEIIAETTGEEPAADMASDAATDITSVAAETPALHDELAAPSEIASDASDDEEEEAEVDAEAPADVTSEAETEAPATEAAETPAAEATTEAPAADSAAVDMAAAAGSVLPTGRLFEKPAAPIVAPDVKKAKKKKKKKVIGEHAFKDYYAFTEAVGRIPPHRILAINRGERARAIRVKIEADLEAMYRDAEELIVRADHPHADFLRGVLRDALNRLMVPSLEREIRREMTDFAETHAVDVFIRNLRKLLLAQPVRGRRVLAVDPGFKSGCKLVALDEFGNVLGHGMIYVIGKDDRRQKAKNRLAEIIKQYNVSVIAIGNGTGCRETEQLVADVLSNEVAGRDCAYVIVNEAGASIYSTSPLGREELPQYDALQRGAISIGRRLLDPLSEMVKINPANLGVGLYQHDMKAKHLKESLDAVVESCVNFVGVDVNSASPALLRYVSGMNALTARRVYEYRREHGPFHNREDLKKVPGFGDATFVQAAGFLKILGGENALDATSIHPESYSIAIRVLEKIGSDVQELAQAVPLPPKPPEPAPFGLLPDVAPVAVAPAVAEAAPAVEAPAPAPETPAGEAMSSEGGPVDSPAAPGTPAAEPTVADVAVAAAEPIAEPVAEAAAEPVAAEVTPVQLVGIPAATDESLARKIAEQAAAVDVKKLAEELQIGQHLLEDILATLKKPGLDPRDSLSAPLLRRGIMKLEDLEPGMELSGSVLNVVDFGVFVDIGLSDSGLVHISRLADRYIRDPHEVVGVGDVLKVWVVEVDKSRRRVSLTAIAPGSEKPQRPPRGERGPRQPRGDRGPRPQGAEGAAAGAQPSGGQYQGGRPQGSRPQGQGQGQGGQGNRGPRPQPAGAGGPPGGGNRPPRSGGGGGGGRGPGNRGGGRNDRPPRPTTVERAPTKPKVVKPLSKAQETGKEPMRSFGDLLQFLDKKKKPDDK